MKQADEGTDLMKEIAKAVREGAYAYLGRQYRVVTIVFVVLLVILAALAFAGVQNPFVPIAFLTGGFFSGLAGYLGMKTATYASNRTAQGATTSLNRALKVAFRSGAVMGLVVVGLGLLDIALWYLILDNLVYTPAHMETGWEFLGLTLVKAGTTPHEKLVEITVTMLTFGMGASTQALFARVGGGIYTRPQTWVLTSLERLKLESRKTTPETLQQSLITLVTTLGTSLVWALTFMNPTVDQSCPQRLLEPPYPSLIKV